jgi:hypothetical protein
VPLATALCKTFLLRMSTTVEQAETQLRVVVQIEEEIYFNCRSFEHVKICGYH